MCIVAVVALRTGGGGDTLNGSRHPRGRMGRYAIDCRAYPSEQGCTVRIEADTEDEVLRAAAHHAADVHGHEDGEALRDALRGMMEQAA